MVGCIKKNKRTSVKVEKAASLIFYAKMALKLYQDIKKETFSQRLT